MEVFSFSKCCTLYMGQCHSKTALLSTYCGIIHRKIEHKHYQLTIKYAICNMITVIYYIDIK